MNNEQKAKRHHLKKIERAIDATIDMAHIGLEEYTRSLLARLNRMHTDCMDEIDALDGNTEWVRGPEPMLDRP